MASITQDMRFRLSLINYANKYGVTKAAVKYKTNRQYIYCWKRRFDGSIESLRDRQDVLIIIQTNILRKKSSSLLICADAILMPVWLCSG